MSSFITSALSTAWRVTKQIMAKRKNTSGANLTHEEIWDDTALVRSWDEAVAEYNVQISAGCRYTRMERTVLG
jgi:hypothetical protein